VLGTQLGFRAVDRGERRFAVTEQAGQRHAVNLPAWRGGEGMAVHVGVDPDQADRPLVGQRAMHPAPGADRAGMVAAHHQREMPRLQHRFHFRRQPRTERRDGMQRRVLCLARHPQDRVPLHVLQRRVMKHPVAAQRIRPFGGGRVGRAGAAGGANNDDAARGGNRGWLHAVAWQARRLIPARPDSRTWFPGIRRCRCARLRAPAPTA